MAVNIAWPNRDGEDPGRVPPRALYLHIPFCRRRCGYCNFTVAAGREDLHVRYVAAVTREIETATRETADRRLDTIFWGGGTPTQLEDAGIERLLQELAGRFTWGADVEFSLEANPEDLPAGRLARLARLGVTRVSLGVQSFRREKLGRLERVHTGREAERAVREAKQAGLRVGVDLIFAAPGETPAQWRQDLRRATRLRPDHVSTYGMTYEKGAAFWGRRQRGRLQAVAEDDEARMYQDAIEILAEEGYEHYEISNFALPEARCRHNIAYWQGRSYYGFGAGAARLLDGAREVNHRSTSAYLRRVEAGLDPTQECDRPPLAERMRERLAFGLRMLEGVAFGEEVEQAWRSRDPLVSEQIERLAAWGLLQRDGQILRLTARGVMVADSVASRLLNP